jgi:hypothetical protein
MAAVTENGEALKHANADMQDDFRIVMAAVAQDGILQFGTRAPASGKTLT